MPYGWSNPHMLLGVSHRPSLSKFIPCLTNPIWQSWDIIKYHKMSISIKLEGSHCHWIGLREFPQEPRSFLRQSPFSHPRLCGRFLRQGPVKAAEMFKVLLNDARSRDVIQTSFASRRPPALWKTAAKIVIFPGDDYMEREREWLYNIIYIWLYLYIY